MYTFILLIVFVLALAVVASYFLDDVLVDPGAYDDKPEDANADEAIEAPKEQAVLAAKPPKAKKKAEPKSKPKPKRRPRDR